MTYDNVDRFTNTNLDNRVKRVNRVKRSNINE